MCARQDESGASSATGGRRAPLCASEAESRLLKTALSKYALWNNELKYQYASGDMDANWTSHDSKSMTRFFVLIFTL
jgi:hypothetical protein